MESFTLLIVNESFEIRGLSVQNVFSVLHGLSNIYLRGRDTAEGLKGGRDRRGERGSVVGEEGRHLLLWETVQTLCLFKEAKKEVQRNVIKNFVQKCRLTKPPKPLYEKLRVGGWIVKLVPKEWKNFFSRFI